MEASVDRETRLRNLIAEVMDVESVMLNGDKGETIRAVGRLRGPAHEAFERLRPPFEDMGHTPLLRREDGLDVVRAVPEVFEPEVGSPVIHVVLFVATVLSVLATGTMNEISSLPITVDKVIEALPNGLLFMVSLLGILGAHEMGHYLMARRHGVKTTLPFFIPFPTFLGTMGAVIAMKEPSPNRRVQFDIGVAGPIAGLVIAIPVLLIGLSLSDVYSQAEILQILPPGAGLIQEGNSLLYLGAKFLIFGQVLPAPDGTDVFIHAVAFAGWAGLLVTAINLFPVGQLDGGHVLYGLLGGRARYAIWPVLAVLLGLSLLTNYQGWLILVLLLFLVARRNAIVLDEITDLDAPRTAVAIAMLLVFALIFVPIPLRPVPLP